MDEQKVGAEQKPRLVTVLEELDADDYAGMLERTEAVVIHLRNEPRMVLVGTKDWEDTRNAWKRKHPPPTPPYREDYTKADSPRGRALRLTEPAFVKVYDDRDPDYQIKLEEWQDDLNFLLVGKCLRLKLKKSGQEVTDPEERGNILRGMGLQPLQAAGIVGVISRLSALARSDAVGFSGGSSDSQPSTTGASSSQVHGSSSREPDLQG